jgi:hypothetical protein
MVINRMMPAAKPPEKSESAKRDVSQVYGVKVRDMRSEVGDKSARVEKSVDGST